jgi:hypothetical protein
MPRLFVEQSRPAKAASREHGGAGHGGTDDEHDSETNEHGGLLEDTLVIASSGSTSVRAHVSGRASVRTATPP